ncbi:MAG: energy-coupling factor ABC transporter ATP-binding protein [Bifidobacterium longum]|nr:energy-coupling factor ABC transporter ATP-binding protein [Bifidobacterium longum]
MGGDQSQPNATAIIGTGKGGPLDTSAGTIASRGISFTYDHAAEPALRDITLTVPAGECIVLCGASGCGKTSYTRVANGLIPSFFHGAFAGSQTTCGLDVETVPIDRLTPLVGSVFQNPKTQYFNANVTDELAFPAENIGLPAEDINRRITAVAERFGIGHLLHRSIFHLSGGQKQRIAVAAATMLGPRLVVLDEPTSNLDANAIADMRAMIEQMKDEGLTIVIAEHRLAWLNGVADRYVVFDGGHIVQDYEADEFLSLSPGCVAAMGLRALDLQPYRRRIAALASSPAADECTSVLLGTHNLTIGYKGKDGFTRAIPDLRFRAGEITGLMGNNGCGKTTLVRTLTGLIKPVSGRIELNGVPAKPRDLTRAGFLVMQDVNYQLFSDSVREELLIGLDETDAGITAQANQVMADLDFAAFAERHPMSLSGGQKQRVAIGSALMCGKDLIILDEPTSGLDRYHMEQVGELLRQLASQGKAILVVTHDEELAAGWCDRIVNLGADDSGNNGSHASNPDASSPNPNASTNFATASTHERNAQ